MCVCELALNPPARLAMTYLRWLETTSAQTVIGRSNSVGP